MAITAEAVKALSAQLYDWSLRRVPEDTKAGLRAVARIFAVELVSQGIRVNMVSPGPTETPIINRNPGMDAAAVDGLRQMMIANTPMRRMGTPEEIARAVLFLSSDEASFITGVDLFVDGGVIEL